MFNMYYNGIKRMLRDGCAGIPNLSLRNDATGLKRDEGIKLSALNIDNYYTLFKVICRAYDNLKLIVFLQFLDGENYASNATPALGLLILILHFGNILTGICICINMMNTLLCYCMEIEQQGYEK